jgi:hypothetical protein
MTAQPLKPREEKSYCVGAKRRDREGTSSLSVKLGRWFEAKATGWGVAALPALMVAVAVIVGARLLGV